MSKVKSHYDQHLGPIYSWMTGGVPATIERAREELATLGVVAVRDRRSVDLGCGFGPHAVALADLGYRVIAVDNCPALLQELEAARDNRPIETVLSDAADFPAACPAPVDLVLCMGDTLTHLATPEAVEKLFGDIKSCLAPGGRFIATFRDYCTAPLQGTSRFIPVRSDDHRILTAFLEYGEQHVMVHDILQQRGPSGWETSVSAYPKLRLDPSLLAARLTEMGMPAEVGAAARGMVLLSARLGE